MRFVGYVSDVGRAVRSIRFRLMINNQVVEEKDAPAALSGNTWVAQKDHITQNPFIAISYLLIFAIFGGTIYFVQQQHVNTERRTRATNAVSCDYTIDIVSPTPTPVAATATQTETPTSTQAVIAPPAATPTIPDVV